LKLQQSVFSIKNSPVFNNIFATLSIVTMASGPLKAALLIVSTTAAKDASADASGPILTQVLKDEGEGKWEVYDTKIVTDDVLAIQRQITAWTDGSDSINLVVTTGGTGFATGDSTPEVSSNVGTRDT
jgi:gephyrin